MPYIELFMAVLAAVANAERVDATIKEDGMGVLSIVLPTEKAYFHFGRLYHRLEMLMAKASLTFAASSNEIESLQLILSSDEDLLCQLAAVADLSITDNRTVLA